MPSSVAQIDTGGRTRPEVHRTWVLFLTTYGLITGGALLLAIRQARSVYVFLPLLFCAAHALAVGPEGRGVISQRWKELLTVGALLACLGHAHVTDQHFSYGLEHFLIAVQIILLYGRTLSVRDFRLIQITAIFELMAAGRWVREFAYLPAFLLGAAFLLANMLAVELHRAGSAEMTARGVRRRPRSVPRLRDFLSAFGVPAVLAGFFTLVCFLVLPRYERLPERQERGSAVTGFSEEVSLLSVGQVHQDETVAFRARFQPLNPEQCPRDLLDSVLMRGTALFRYEGGRWLSKSESIRQWSRTGERPPGVSRNEFFLSKPYVLESTDIRVCRVAQRVELESPPRSTLFALYRPVEFAGDQQGEMLINSITHHLPPTVSRGKPLSYDIISEVPLFTPEQLRRAGTPPPRGHWPELFVIPADIRIELDRVGYQIQDRYKPRTDYDRVMAVQKYLMDSGRFTYTLDLPDFGDQDPLVAFLIDTHTGNCEQFATAMALLVRTWSIPSRLVIGYRGNWLETEDDMYVFRERNAHSWVEVYFNGLGWVPFDPTPGVPGMGDQAPSRGLASLMDAAMKAVQYRGHTFWHGILSYDRATQEKLFSGLETAAHNLAADAATVLRNVLPAVPGLGLLRVVALVALFLTAGAVLYLAATWLEGRLARWRIRPRRGTTLRFYQDLLQILRKKGISSPASATPRELARTASRELGRTNGGNREVPQAVHLVTELYCRVRFGNRTLTAQQQSQLRDALRALKSARPARAG